MLLTGHVTLNYHLNKYKPDKISKTCPHCLAEEETTNHYIGQCPKWSAQRSAVFNSFYLSISEVVDDGNATFYPPVFLPPTFYPPSFYPPTFYPHAYSQIALLFTGGKKSHFASKYDFYPRKGRGTTFYLPFYRYRLNHMI